MLSQIKSELLKYIKKYRYILIISILGIAYLLNHSNHRLEYKLKFSIPMSGEYPAIPTNELSKKIMQGEFYSPEIINQCIKIGEKNINGVDELKKIVKIYSDPVNFNITLVISSPNSEDYTKCINLIYKNIENKIEPIAMEKIIFNISEIKRIELELSNLSKIKKYIANYNYTVIDRALINIENENLFLIERLSRSIQYKKMEIIGYLDIKKKKYIFNNISILLSILLLVILLLIIKNK